MRFQLAFLFSFLFSFSSFAQLYSGHKGWQIYFAEISGDSARVEVYSSYKYFVHVISDEYVKLEDAETKPSREKQNRIIKTKDKVYILHKFKKKYIKAELKSIEIDNREIFRKKAYSGRKANEVHTLSDSLSVEHHFGYHNLHFSLENLPYKEYINEVDRKVDSAKTNIINSKDSFVTYYYTMASNIKHIDSTVIFDLLSQADYQKAYGKYLVHEVALLKPEYLIHYINKKPSNMKPILRVIRQHDNFKKIVSTIQTQSGKSKGKRLIVKQKFNRHLSDAGIATGLITIVLAELAVIPLLIIWIF